MQRILFLFSMKKSGQYFFNDGVGYFLQISVVYVVSNNVLRVMLASSSVSMNYPVVDANSSSEIYPVDKSSK